MSGSSYLESCSRISKSYETRIIAVIVSANVYATCIPRIRYKLNTVIRLCNIWPEILPLYARYFIRIVFLIRIRPYIDII